jgi:hypothetical protein
MNALRQSPRHKAPGAGLPPPGRVVEGFKKLASKNRLDINGAGQAIPAGAGAANQLGNTNRFLCVRIPHVQRHGDP